MKKSLLFIFLLNLTACQPHPQTSAFNQGDYKLPFDKWGFVFFAPWKLRTLVTDAIVVDTTGRMYRFHTLDWPSNDPQSIGTWNTKFRSLPGYNIIKNAAPPQYIVLCWDSWVDKKHYETSMFFYKPVWQRMMTPLDHHASDDGPLWYNTLLFGLAPGGGVKVWFQASEDDGRENYPVTPINMKTLSGDSLDVCKGVSQNVFSKEMAPDIAEFIKDKKFPYGNW
ncbi:DUF2931 family protein [Citrobacter amalonaticus]|nr:DUF2931 family protein [Citrobacter amalonaticus]